MRCSPFRAAPPQGDIETSAYITEYDTHHGRFLSGKISTEGDIINFNGTKVKFLQIASPADVPIAELGVTVVMECTGKFCSVAKERPPLSSHTRRSSSSLNRNGAAALSCRHPQWRALLRGSTLLGGRPFGSPREASRRLLASQVQPFLDLGAKKVVVSAPVKASADPQPRLPLRTPGRPRSRRYLCAYSG